MRALINKRPSVASVLSIIALFAALGGTSYAAATISGKMVQNGTLTGVDVKNRSLSGADQKRNTLGGAQIAESKLGQVPKAAKAAQADKATQADKASTADSATTVPDNSINGAKVADRSLSANDLAVANGSPTLDLPSIPANDCFYVLHDTNVNLSGATVSVSAPSGGPFSSGGLSIHVAKSNIADSFRLVACNVTAAAIDPAPAEFDYTAIK